MIKIEKPMTINCFAATSVLHEDVALRLTNFVELVTFHDKRFEVLPAKQKCVCLKLNIAQPTQLNVKKSSYAPNVATNYPQDSNVNNILSKV